MLDLKNFHPKEIQLLLFFREKKFGKFEVIIHAGLPQKIIQKEIYYPIEGNISQGDLTRFLDGDKKK